MKVAFVGAGPASIFGALYLKKNRPDIEVYLFDKNSSIGKKLSMTGNGKCNIAPIKDNIEEYNNPKRVKTLFDEYPLNKYLDLLREFNIETKNLSNFGYYPVSESAPNVIKILESDLQTYGIHFVNEKVMGYSLKNDSVELSFEHRFESFDHVFFATGGCSYPNSGSDGKAFSIFTSKGYKVNKPEPRLCPVVVKENVKSLFGARAKALCSLYTNGRLVKQEKGEVMFKKDGLSGMCIMNLSRFIDLKQKNFIEINFLSDINVVCMNSMTALVYLLSFVPYPIAEYVLKQVRMREDTPLDETRATELLDALKEMDFTVKGLYGFDNAQITRGGIDIDEVDEYFRSKKENHLSFIGEMVDIDAACGGYNLRFAITSGFKAVEILFDK